MQAQLELMIRVGPLPSATADPGGMRRENPRIRASEALGCVGGVLIVCHNLTYGPRAPMGMTRIPSERR